MLYAFFWAILRHLNFICQRFRTLCMFHLHRQVVVWRMTTFFFFIRIHVINYRYIRYTVYRIYTQQFSFLCLVTLSNLWEWYINYFQSLLLIAKHWLPGRMFSAPRKFWNHHAEIKLFLLLFFLHKKVSSPASSIILTHSQRKVARQSRNVCLLFSTQ